MVRNMECMLVRYTGATPFKRCQYCNRQVQDCFGLLFFVISVSIIGLLTTTFFISDIPILILDIIILVDLLVILLAFLASKETSVILIPT